MARLGTWALLVLLLFISTNARPASEPEPAPDPEIKLQPKSVEFMWNKTVSWAVVIAAVPVCRNLLFALTGQDPVVMLLEPELIITLPETWLEHESEYAALTTCGPPMIAIRREVFMLYGPLSGAVLLIHELAHIGTCDRVADGSVGGEDWEEMASTVDRFCFSELSKYEF